MADTNSFEEKPAPNNTMSWADQDRKAMIRAAEDADRLDHELTIRQALKKYKKAVFWAMLLSVALVMEGYDVVVIGAFYGQSQFREKFGTVGVDGIKQIPAAWQSGLSNASVCGQLIGLAINGYLQDKLGCRITYMGGMVWMACVIFIPVFATSLPVLVVGQVLCGTAWGMFQTLSTTYASEVVPTCLRPIVTAWVCMCWGAGIIISSGVVRAMVGFDPNGNWGWRLPFALQWAWPLPLALAAFLAPESPWNACRRKNYTQARDALTRLRGGANASEKEVDNALAYITYITEKEEAETAGASYLECFRGTNLRRTEINCVVWAAQILCGNAILGFAVTFLQRAGFSETASFNLNLITNCQYLVGGAICWVLMTRFGRATLYMGGLIVMFICLIITGALGFVDSKGASIGVGVLLVFQTLVNMTTIGPVCYPIVAETPSGRLRARTITIGRIVYNLTGIFSNSVTPRMIQPEAWNWGAKGALFYAGTNALCLLWCWFRLPETKDRTFGEIDLLFEQKVSARKFKHTRVDQFAEVRGGESVVTPAAIDEEKKIETAHREYV